MQCLLAAGEKAQFSCATDASVKNLTATWLKDNKPLEDKLADRIKILAQENHFTLELQNVMVEDSGHYTCRVSGADGNTITCSAQLEVHECECIQRVSVSSTPSKFSFLNSNARGEEGKGGLESPRVHGQVARRRVPPQLGRLVHDPRQGQPQSGCQIVSN